MSNAIPDNLVPDEAPTYIQAENKGVEIPVELKEVVSFSAEKRDETHLYGWITFEWEANTSNCERRYADSQKRWETKEYVKVEKGNIPEIPVDLL